MVLIHIAQLTVNNVRLLERDRRFMMKEEKKREKEERKEKRNREEKREKKQRENTPPVVKKYIKVCVTSAACVLL